MQPPEEVPTYSELGIKKTQAHRWQQMASVPEEQGRKPGDRPSVKTDRLGMAEKEVALPTLD